MMRSLFVALATTVVFAAAGTREVSAQQNPPNLPQQIPLHFAGGAPGVSIEIFLNAGKVADVTLNSTGGGDSILNFANVGKTRVQIYVDVCKDGKVVKVMFVTGNGQPPPEDEGCDRRIAAVSFQSDCGAISINFDFRNFGAKVIGCGMTFTDPKILATLGGVVTGVAVLAGTGGSGPAASVTPATAAPPVTAPPVTAAPPATTPPSTTPPATPPPAATPASLQVGFLVVMVVHGSNTSFICGILNGQQLPSGTRFVLTASGPAVLPGQNVSGTFNSNGQAAFSLGIGSFGGYNLTAMATAPNGATGTATTTHNVTSSGVQSCPTLVAAQ